MSTTPNPTNMEDTTWEEQELSLIEECISIRGNTAYNGSYAAPREAYRKVLQLAEERGERKGREEERNKIIKFIWEAPNPYMFPATFDRLVRELKALTPPSV